MHIDGIEARGFMAALRRARDAAEFGAHLGRNSAVSPFIHVAMGMGLAAGATLGVASLKDTHPHADGTPSDRDSWLTFSRNAVSAGGALAVVITAGAQLGTTQGSPLARGLVPLYGLGVGAAAFSYFVVNKFQDAYAN